MLEPFPAADTVSARHTSLGPAPSTRITSTRPLVDNQAPPYRQKTFAGTTTRGDAGTADASTNTSAQSATAHILGLRALGTPVGKTAKAGTALVLRGRNYWNACMGCMGHCYLGHSVTCVTFHAQSEYLGIRMLDSKMCMGVALRSFERERLRRQA